MIEHTSALFVSDLHLSESSRQLPAQFHQFLAAQAASVDAVFILGDLFEAWIGDDLLLRDAQQFPVQHQVVETLRAYASTGKPLYLMHGNRDFLLADGFVRSIGGNTRILPDPVVALIAGKRTLISHGDAYCTDDLPYQEFRRTSRSARWIAQTLSLSLEQRVTIADSMRVESEQAKLGKSEDIMDVNAAAIDTAFASHAVAVMVHGHTHRPAHHQLACGERYVLPDWHYGEPYSRGGGLLATPSAWQFLSLAPVSQTTSPAG